MTVEQIMREEGQDLVASLRMAYARQNVNASGRLSKTTEDTVTLTPKGVELKIEVNSYGLLLREGRGPSKRSDGGQLFAQIRQWIDDKGITPKNGSKTSLAWAITQSIHKRGTKAFRTKNGPDFFEKTLDDARINKLIRKIGDAAEGEVLTKLDEIIDLRYARN